MLFEEVYVKFKIYVRYRHKKQGYYNICHDFECRILPYFKNKNIYNLSKIDFLNWQDLILSFNFSNSYNKRLYYVFNSFIDYCVKYYDLPNNLLRSIGSFPKKIEHKKFDFYNLDEFYLFVSNIDNPIYKAYYIFMFYTGCRPGESMALRFCDIDDHYVHIEHNIHRKGDRSLDTPKNQSSIRDIIINDDLKEFLLSLKKLYSNCDENYFVFGGSKPLSSTTADRVKKKACDKANLRVITQHQFRHSSATFLLNNNIPISEISRRLGHSKISTTLDIYCHNDLSHEKRVLAILSSLNPKSMLDTDVSN